MRPRKYRSVIHLLAVATFGVAGLFCASAVAQRAVPIEAQALQTPQSRDEGGQALDSAVAAALIGAISSQFGASKVEVTLDAVSVAPLSIRDRSVSGNGRLRLNDERDWVEMSFRALYDTANASVSQPTLVLGDADGADPVELDSKLALGLDHEVNAALASEFSEQSVQLLIERVTATAAGERFVQVTALGTAEFAGEGTTAAQVSALYDNKTRQWVRVDYELGTTSNRVDPTEPAVASN